MPTVVQGLLLGANGADSECLWGTICVKSVILAWIYISDGRYRYRMGDIHIGREILITDGRYTYRTEDIHI